MKTLFALIGVVTLVFGFMALGVLVGIHSSVSQNATSATDGATPVTQTELRALPVQAERLFLDYQRNEVAADQKYRGRRLLVTGMVTSVNKDFTDKVYLMLGTSTMFMWVHASLEPSEVGRAGELQKGEEVTVLCSGGMMIVDSPTLDDCVFHAAPVENEAPGPTYSPQPSKERQQATVPVINAANVTPAPAAAPVFQQSVDEYEDQALRAMKAHWVIPAGVPGGALTQMSFEIAADGRVYDAMVKTPSESTDLDRSCLDALNQVEQMGPTPTGQVLEVDFDCHVTR
jgi:tRNA_anti-like/TonB C terminal